MKQANLSQCVTTVYILFTWCLMCWTWWVTPDLSDRTRKAETEKKGLQGIHWLCTVGDQ